MKSNKSNRDIKRENAEIAVCVENISRMPGRDAVCVYDFINTLNDGYIHGMWQFRNIFEAKWYYDYTQKEYRAFMAKLAKKLDENGWSLTD